MAGRPDIVVVSLGTTMGLRGADEAFAGQLRAAGASCEVVRVHVGRSGRLRVTMAATDLVEALAARRAAAGRAAAAVVYSSVTAALLQPPRSPAAVRFDSVAALNRPGGGGAWQRRRERAVLGRADLLLPWSEAAGAAALRAAGRDAPRTVVLPPPVPAMPAPEGPGFDALAYAGDPRKRGIDLLYEAWRLARPDGARLALAGVERGEAQRRLGAGVEEPPGVHWLGALPRERWLSTVAGARVFVNASRHEDWGLAQMEALAAGVPLVTVPSAGTDAALGLARELAPALVAPERSAPALAGALRAGLELGGADREAYARRATRLLEPYREAELRRRVAEEVLPLLLRSSS